MNGLHRTLSTAVFAALITPALLAAQPSEEVRDLESRLPAPKLVPKLDFGISLTREARLKNLLPQTWQRLSQREPLHVLMLGEAELLEMWTEDGQPQPMHTFPFVFARDLAAQFFYTGGVRVECAAAMDTILSPGISLRTLTRPHGSVLDAASILASTARQSPVHLVLLCYGRREAEAGMSPVRFVSAMKRAVAAATEIGAEVVLCAPPLEAGAQAELTLGRARPLADALLEYAREEELMCADLGKLSRMLDLPENDAKDVAQVFDRLAGAYRGFFHESADGEMQPRLSFHQRLGSLLFQEMLEVEAVSKWSLKEVVAIWQKEGAEIAVHGTIENESKSRLELTLLPLIAAGWKPVDVQPRVSLPAGASQTVMFRLARATSLEVPIQENVLRLPVLTLADKEARVETWRATLQPLCVVWDSQTLFNQEKHVSLSGKIVNGSDKEQRGSWEAEFLGGTLRGSFDLKPGGAQPLDLSFDQPSDALFARVGDLKLVIKADGLTLTSKALVTLTRQLGLKRSVPLLSEGDAKGTLSLSAEADARHLLLKWTVRGSEMLLDANAPGAAAWQLELNLDARSYGKRLEPGSTAAILVTGGAAPGKAQVHELAPWAFGSGYAAAFDAKELSAAMTAPRDDEREITLKIPRSYLYLHEWALENGNSQLGISLRLTLNTAQGYRTWTLNPTTKPSDDVEALCVLELTEKPTARMTVDLH